MRKISRDVQRKIFKLWIEGHTYREISPKCGGVSLATISKIVDDARKRTPDIDELRHLNVTLKRSGISVYDAMRGGRLLDEVAQLGVGLDDLEDYINTAERISSEKEVEAETFVDSTIRLTHLEAETGKTYGDVIKDFEGKLSDGANLEAKMDGLKGEIEKLTEARVRLEADLTKGKGGLTQTLEELKRTVSAKERLERLSLEKLSNLAKFIEEFEALGFSAQIVRDLGKWRESLREMRIDPNGLKSFVEEKGPLEKQISRLKRKATYQRGVLKRLKKQIRSFRHRNRALSIVDAILTRKRTYLPCKNCGQLLPITLPTQESYNYMIKRGLGIGIRRLPVDRDGVPPRCRYCGYRNWFHPNDVLIDIGWKVLPTKESEEKPLRPSA